MMDKWAPPTLDDVARHAGVSSATVSRCLNTPDQVRSETRERVARAIDRLGYTPHFGGRALASNRTNTIGAVIPTMENAIFARGLQAMQEALAASNVTLLVATSGYRPDREAEQIRALLSRGVDGLLLIGIARPEDTYQMLRRRAVPFVLAWTLSQDHPGRCIGFDNRLAARRLAERVIALGHSRVAMIAGISAWNDRAAERIEGVREALIAAGLSLPVGRLVEAAYTLDAGEAALTALMARRGPGPTAVVCGNDVIAAGALRAARRLAIAVPDDLSIVGFDDIDLAEAVEPELTTVHVPHRRMGAAAAAALLALRDGLPLPDERAFDVSLIERRSLAPPPR